MGGEKLDGPLLYYSIIPYYVGISLFSESLLHHVKRVTYEFLWFRVLPYGIESFEPSMCHPY